LRGFGITCEHHQVAAIDGIESGGKNSGSHAPDSHAASQTEIPFGIYRRDPLARARNGSRVVRDCVVSPCRGLFTAVHKDGGGWARGTARD
jgi:hypothetical protein